MVQNDSEDSSDSQSSSSNSEQSNGEIESVKNEVKQKELAAEKENVSERIVAKDVAVNEDSDIENVEISKDDETQNPKESVPIEVESAKKDKEEIIPSEKSPDKTEKISSDVPHEQNGKNEDKDKVPVEKSKKRERSRSIKRKRESPRRSRSRSRERRRRGRSNSNRRSRSRQRSGSPLRERRRKSRPRSESLERRREERKRRHAQREKQEQESSESKRKRREGSVENTQKENDKTQTNVPTQNNNKKREDNDNATVTDPKARISERQRRTVDLLTSRTGGAYIPPAKLRLLQAEITDKSSAAYQRIAWEALKKSIHGYINKVNVDNIAIITRELLKENIVRGRGLLCRSIIQAQAASPTFTHVYAALVAIINSKFPNIGELLLKRLVIQFKRAFRRNDKAVCISSSRFVAHLVNQRVAHEILALEILTLLVESPTDDSVEVAISFLKECGMKLTEVSSKGIGAIFEMLRNILHEGRLEKRVQYMIEVVFQVRKDGFKDHQAITEALELVEEDDQFTHLMMLDEANDTEDILNVFKFDDQYQNNEDKYKGLSKEILGSDASDSANSGNSESGSEDSADSDDENDEKPTAGDIIDNTETNLIALRRTIYLTINSSLDYEECAHKLMKMQLKPGQEIELCHMFLDCCAEQRTYEKFYGLLAQRFCTINRIYIGPFEEIFKDTYQTTHRLDTNRLRNVSKFFAHLLFTDAIGWDVLECIKLNEDDTTSSSRIFIKILFQELAEYMGLSKLNGKLKDEALTETLADLFPKDNPRNTRFAINFFTSIGLGGLTDELRQFLKNAPKSVPAINIDILASKPIKKESSSASASSSSSSDSSDSSTSSTSSSSESSDSEKEKKKRKSKVVKKRKEKLEKKKKKSNSKHDLKKKNSKQAKRKSESSGSESDSESDSNSSEEEIRHKKKKSDARGNGREGEKCKKRNEKERTDKDKNRRRSYRDDDRAHDRERKMEPRRERRGREENNRHQYDDRERKARYGEREHKSSRNYSKERG